MWEKFKQFLTDVRSELGKVSWPTRDEIVGSTWVVIFAIAALAIFILLNDQVMSLGVSKLLVRK